VATRTFHRLAALLIGAAASALAAPGFAQAGDAAAAEVLFREGREASAAGDHRRACEKYHESHRLDPATGTMLNIADCEERQGRLATAWTFYRAVIQKLPPSDERAAVATSRAEALEPRLPRLALRLAPGAPASTRVVRDGVELKSASLDSALPVDPGKHVIEITAPGRAAHRFELTIGEGELVEREVSPGAPHASSPALGATGRSDPRSDTRTLGWVLGGVGVLGIAAGSVTGIMVLDRKSVVDANCDSEKRCNQQGADAAESGRSLGTISAASLIVGGAALAAGAYFVLSSDGERPTTALIAGPGDLSLLHRW
jgi:hypothetical protein